MSTPNSYNLLRSSTICDAFDTILAWLRGGGREDDGATGGFATSAIFHLVEGICLQHQFQRSLQILKPPSPPPPSLNIPLVTLVEM